MKNQAHKIRRSNLDVFDKMHFAIIEAEEKIGAGAIYTYLYYYLKGMKKRHEIDKKYEY